MNDTKTHKELLEEALEIKKEILRTTIELDKKLDLIRTLNIPITIGKFAMHLLGLLLKEPAFNWGGIILSGISVAQSPLFFKTKKERDQYRTALNHQETIIENYQEEYVQLLAEALKKAEVNVDTLQPPAIKSTNIHKSKKVKRRNTVKTK